MQQPKGIAVTLGVIFGLVVVAAVVSGILIFRGEWKSQTPATNTNAALQLSCVADSDCVSYCGADPCYQPVCGIVTIGEAGSCTCRSLCGSIAPVSNDNTNTNTAVTVSNFVECAAAGYPVQESYPRKCTAGGVTFIEVLSNTNAAVNTNTSASTVGWKTYTNTAYKFSIQYPVDWILDADSIDSGNLYILTKERQQKLDSKQVVRIMDIGVKVYLSASDLPNNSAKKLSFEDWIKQEADSYGFIQRKPITIDGVVGYQGLGSGDGVSYQVFVQKGIAIFEIQTGDTRTPTQIEQLIIDSFTFTK